MPDLRAHGASGKPHDPANYPPDILVRDLRELIAHLGLERVRSRRVFARRAHDHRCGRRGCGRAGRSSPERGWTCSRNWERRCRFFLDAIERFDDARARRSALAVDPVHADDEDRPARRRGCCSQGLGDHPSPEQALAAFTMPTLVVCGSEDDDNGSARELAEALPNARYRGNPGHAHELGDQAGARRGDRRISRGLTRLDQVPVGSHSEASIPSLGRVEFMKFACFRIACRARAGRLCRRQSPDRRSPPFPTAPLRPQAADALPHPLTPEGARQFIADVEKDLFDLSVIGGRAAVGERDLHQRRHRRARRLFRHDRHREGRASTPSRPRNTRKVPGLDPDTARKLDILRGGLVLAAPTTPGAAAELNEITTGCSRPTARAARRTTASRSPATTSRR